MPKSAVAKVWTFASGSNPNKTYETLQYVDSTTSCNCPGWTRRVDASGNRSCRHTRDVHQGTADANAVSSHDYTSESVPKPQTVAAPKKVKKSSKSSSAPIRKIRWQDDA